jgi:hypothetical protein
MATLKLGMERRLQGQTRGERQGYFEDSFNIDQDLFFKGRFSFGLYTPQLSTIVVVHGYYSYLDYFNPRVSFSH